MLLCSSKIPVIPSLSAPTFIELAIDWVLNSRYYSFGAFVWDGKPEFVCTGDQGESFQVGLFEDQSICAVHFSSTDDRSIKWTTDFILDAAEHVLAFQLYRDAPADIGFVPSAFRLPLLIRNMISAGYCGLDHDLPVQGKPLPIHDEDADWVAAAMLHKTEYTLPIVYVSCEADGQYAVDPSALADQLIGVAHVLYESTRSVSYRLREKTAGANPYAGAIEIFYPRGSRKYLPSQLSAPPTRQVYTIVNSVIGHLVQLRVEDRFSWSHLQSDKLQNQLSATLLKKEQETQEYSELEKTYEEILAEKDSQLKRLTDQLWSANNTIEQLEAQLTAVERLPALVIGDEADLYPYEQQSLLLEILRKELRSTKEGSRRAHILTALLAANQCENTLDEKRSRIKACLHGYTKMTASISAELQDIGFALSDDGKHIKMVFGEDSRYTGTLSKTSSDHRAGDNTAHDLILSIF